MKQQTFELMSAELLPPMALRQFIKQMGVTRKTVHKWRKSGELHTVNIYGRVYVPAKVIVEFNRRAEAGEFSRDIKPTRPARPRGRRLAA